MSRVGALYGDCLNRISTDHQEQTHKSKRLPFLAVKLVQLIDDSLFVPTNFIAVASIHFYRHDFPFLQLSLS